MNVTWTDKCKEVFNEQERQKITDKATEMYKINAISCLLRLDKKEVCLERESAENKNINVFLMDSTLARNSLMIAARTKGRKNSRETKQVALERSMEEMMWTQPVTG